MHRFVLSRVVGPLQPRPDDPIRATSAPRLKLTERDVDATMRRRRRLLGCSYLLSAQGRVSMPEKDIQFTDVSIDELSEEDLRRIFTRSVHASVLRSLLKSAVRSPVAFPALRSALRSTLR